MSFQLGLIPRDGFFVKDGRGWTTSDLRRSRSAAWPAPSVCRGALRSAWGRRRLDMGHPVDWLHDTDHVRLQVVLPARWSAQGGVTLWWPCPADALLGVDGRWRTLSPGPPKFPWVGRRGTDAFTAALEGMWPARIEGGAEKLGPQPLWLESAAFFGWLEDTLPPRSDGQFRGPLDRRLEVRVALDSATGTALDEMLYSLDIVETLDATGDSWGMAVIGTCESPDLLRGPVHVGGKRRIGFLEGLPGESFHLPATLSARFSRGTEGLRVVTVTPVEFERGWLPDGFRPADDGGFVGTLFDGGPKLRLRSAIVGRPSEISGFDMARRRPKTTRRCVPPGSVYYFTREDGGAFDQTTAENLWLRQIGRATADGFGCVVPGAWEPREETR